MTPPEAAPGPDQPLPYTAQQAAHLLQVPVSWLRRKATARAIPCTFVGKHLRFTATNLADIIATGTRPATPARRYR